MDVNNGSLRALRRFLQVVALVGTLIVGVLAVALIVSQTPWFRDWLRRYIVRESKQYLNGELMIGGLGGNLLFGVNLSDVAVDVSGERVVAVKALELDYSVFELVSKGVVLNEIKLSEPAIHLERDASGWNVARLVKEQEREADREGPRRPIDLQSIAISDASVTIDDRVGASGYKLPRRIEGLDLRGHFQYAPVHYSVALDHVSFRGASPQVTLQELAGKFAVRDDNVYIDGVRIRTAESSLTIDGVIEQYLKTPVVALTTTGNVSMPEIGRIVPAASGYTLHPAVNVKANGPAERLALVLDVQSEAGNVRGNVTADVKAPDLGIKGDVELERFNLAPVLKDPAQRTDMTGKATIDLRMPSRPANAPAMERLTGTFTFRGPHVLAAGYEARNVSVTGTMTGPRIEIDGRADAYGGTATARGFIVTPGQGRDLAFDLRGQADSLDLRDLPAATGAPKLATDVSVEEYAVRGEGRTMSGSARLNRSTVEGATIAAGTVADFGLTPSEVTYSARGGVANLNLQRIGRGLQVAALAKPEFDSRVNAQFDVRGSLPRTRPGGKGGEPLANMTVDATGTLTDSELWGGRLPELGFEAHLAGGALDVRTDGRFEGFDPARLAGRQNLQGRITGTVNAAAKVRDITAPITSDAVTAEGALTLAESTVGGLKIDAADIQGKYADQVGDIAKLHLTGPDLKTEASGRIALDRTSASNLKYHVEATNLAELAKLAGQTGIDGAAIIDGAVTGNAASLQAAGTLDGSNLAYQNNRALDLNSTFVVTVPDLQFAKSKVEATTGATFVSAAGLDINQLTAKTTYTPDPEPRIEFTTNIKERTRELDASGALILHPDHQEVHLPQFAVRTQGVEWRAAPGGEATVKYGGGRIALDNVRLVSGDQSLNVDGTLAQAGKEIGEIKVQAANVDIAQLETLLLQDRGFTGRLSADATITGTTESPVVDGHVEVQNGSFQSYKYQSLVGDVDYTSRRVNLDVTLQQSPTESITAKGAVPMSLFQKGPGGHVTPSAEDTVDLQVKSNALQLGIVQGFTNQVANVTGTLEADVRVTGSGQDPHVEGFVDIKNGAFGVPAGGVSYTGLNTRIELDTDTVRLQKFRILDEHGEWLSVEGQLAVHEKQVGEVNIAIASDNFELIDNELGDVGVDTELRISGELRRPRIEGDVRLEAGRLEVDRLLQLFYDPYSVESLPEVVSAERSVEGSGSAEEATRDALSRAERSAAAPGAKEAEARDTGAPPPAGLAGAMSVDVRVRIPDNLVLRGQDLRPGGPTGTALGDLNITVGGDVRMRKEPGGQFTLVGTANTVRGTYEFQGRRFDLVRGGALRFVGETEINPFLDISATRTIPDTGVEVRIRITGTAKAPELQLSSNPPLEESDILALIVFNRQVNELGTGERASLAATAGGIATGFIAAPLGESIGRALDLDLFEITTTTEEGDFGAGVTLGQQIGDRAFVKLRQQFGERNASEFLIEYQLFDFLRLQTTAAPETSGSGNRLNQRRIERAGIDLIFFFSY
jgi:autotransporter translocation and assembly factor TamB